MYLIEEGFYLLVLLFFMVLELMARYFYLNLIIKYFQIILV